MKASILGRLVGRHCWACIVIGLAVLHASVGASNAGEPSRHPLRFDVTDPRDEFLVEIDPELTLRVWQVRNEAVPHFGWEVQVLKRGARRAHANVLRFPALGPGPHPFDILAWLVRDRRFPDERTIQVPEYPYEITIRLIGCRTTILNNSASFIDGEVEISWHRLDLARTAPLVPMP